jgi:hypothetical protein
MFEMSELVQAGVLEDVFLCGRSARPYSRDQPYRVDRARRVPLRSFWRSLLAGVCMCRSWRSGLLRRAGGGWPASAVRSDGPVWRFRCCLVLARGRCGKGDRWGRCGTRGTVLSVAGTVWRVPCREVWWSPCPRRSVGGEEGWVSVSGPVCCYTP